MKHFRFRAVIFATIAAWLIFVASDPAVAATEQWHLDFLHVTQAQAISQGAGVVVAVVDSGVDAGHPDLAGNVLPGIDLATPSGDGRVDLLGHGTGMAGLIAGHGKAVGIAPAAKILPVRVAADDITTPAAVRNIAAGIDFAVARGATVINISVGDQLGDPAEEAAIRKALASNVVVVAAAGNTDQVASIIYPAAYPGVVAVSGVDRQGNHARISVTGSAAVIAAPAVDIYSTNSRNVAGGGYRVADGTSDAAAIVSGVAALIRSKFPTMSAAEVVHRLEATADDKGAPGRDPVYGYGIVDPVKALTANVPPLTASPSPSGTQVSPAPAGNGTRTNPFLVIVLGAMGGAAIVVLAMYVRRRFAGG
jgi:type VII secretion-associated serine protease mycosin